MNTLTIIVLAILLIAAMIGLKKGAVKMLFSFFSLLLTIILATIISPIVSEKLQQTAVYDSVYQKTYQYVNERIMQAAADTMDEAMKELELPDIIQKVIKQEQHIEITQATVAVVISTKITKIIFDVLVFVITFIIASLLVKIIATALNIVAMLPVIHGANRLLGLGIGLLEGLLVVWIFFIVITMMGNSDFAVNMYKQINESPILTGLYNNNIIMNILFK